MFGWRQTSSHVPDIQYFCSNFMRKIIYIHCWVFFPCNSIRFLNGTAVKLTTIKYFYQSWIVFVRKTGMYPNCCCNDCIYIGDLVVLIRQKTIVNVHLSHVETSMIKSKLNDQTLKKIVALFKSVYSQFITKAYLIRHLSYN